MITLSSLKYLSASEKVKARRRNRGERKKNRISFFLL